MKKQIINLLLSLFTIGSTHAQLNFGPKITAMGKNSAAVPDIWSVGGNPALISTVLTPTLAMDYTLYLVNPTLSSQAIGIVLPIKNQNVGLYFHRYGILSYHELSASGIVSKKFGKLLSIAIRLNFHQIQISSYGGTTAFSIDIGASYKLTEALIIGAFITNPTFQNYGSKMVEIIPTTCYGGISYLVTDKVMMAITAHKTTGLEFDFGLGMNYKLFELLSIRGGISMNPFKQYVGFGLILKKLTIDLAMQSNPFFSFTPQIGLTYVF